MSKIRSRDTKVEKIIFQALRKRGIYFQKYYRGAIGNPDVAIPRKKLAVFIDGDFWHGYQFQKLKKRLPKKYWVAKIGRNVVRDRRFRSQLRRKGWKVLRVWEHSINKNRQAVINSIELFLKNRA
jgi:DNA mismatch endonuclease (patch repair protein)